MINFCLVFLHRCAFFDRYVIKFYFFSNSFFSSFFFISSITLARFEFNKRFEKSHVTLNTRSVEVIKEGIPMLFCCKTTINDQKFGAISVPAHAGLLLIDEGNGISNWASNCSRKV